MPDCPSPERMLKGLLEPLAPDDRAALTAHLRDCAACRDRYGFYRALGYNQAAHSHPLPEAGPDCPEEMTVALLAEGGLDESGARIARAHVVDCPRCFQLLDAAMAEARHQRQSAESPAAVPVLVNEPSGVTAFLERVLRPRVLGPVMGVVATLLVIAIFPRGGGDDLAGLARVEPLPVRITRDVTDDAEVQAPYAEGRAAYATGDYGRAVEAFEASDDTAERDLFLASALALTGRDHDARPILVETIEDGPAPIAHEARWLLAQLELRDGHRPEAILLLRELRDARGRRSGAAAELLDALGD